MNIYYRYLLGWFAIDLITSFPFEFIFQSIESTQIIDLIKAFRIIRVLRIIKLLRFVKMMNILNQLLYETFSRNFVIFLKLLRMLCVMIIFAHLGACSWYACGDYSFTHGMSSWIEAHGIAGDEATQWEKYSTSWYFSVVTLMTTGYGDIVATNTLEQWVASIFILIGTCFFAYLVGALGALLADGDRVKLEVSEKIEQAHQFCVSKKLPHDLAHAVLTHTKYHCKHNFLFDEMKILNTLPSHLRYVMSLSVFLFVCFVLFV